MNKKNYIIIASILSLIALVIIIFLLTGDKKVNWIKEIETSDKYSITILDCNNNKRKIPKEALNEISTKWKELSDNGPWMGDENACYTTVTITYEKEGIVKEAELKLIDDSSLVLSIETTKEYFNNSQNLNSYLISELK